MSATTNMHRTNAVHDSFMSQRNTGMRRPPNSRPDNNQRQPDDQSGSYDPQSSQKQSFPQADASSGQHNCDLLHGEGGGGQIQNATNPSMQAQRQGMPENPQSHQSAPVPFNAASSSQHGLPIGQDQTMLLQQQSMASPSGLPLTGEHRHAQHILPHVPTNHVFTCVCHECQTPMASHTFGHSICSSCGHGICPRCISDTQQALVLGRAMLNDAESSCIGQTPRFDASSGGHPHNLPRQNVGQQPASNPMSQTLVPSSCSYHAPGTQNAFPLPNSVAAHDTSVNAYPRVQGKPPSDLQNNPSGMQFNVAGHGVDMPCCPDINSGTTTRVPVTGDSCYPEVPGGASGMSTGNGAFQYQQPYSGSGPGVSNNCQMPTGSLLQNSDHSQPSFCPSEFGSYMSGPQLGMANTQPTNGATSLNPLVPVLGVQPRADTLAGQVPGNRLANQDSPEMNGCDTQGTDDATSSQAFPHHTDHNTSTQSRRDNLHRETRGNSLQDNPFLIADRKSRRDLSGANAPQPINEKRRNPNAVCLPKDVRTSQSAGQDDQGDIKDERSLLVDKLGPKELSQLGQLLQVLGKEEPNKSYSTIDLSGITAGQGFDQTERKTALGSQNAPRPKQVANKQTGDHEQQRLDPEVSSVGASRSTVRPQCSVGDTYSNDYRDFEDDKHDAQSPWDNIRVADNPSQWLKRASTAYTTFSCEDTQPLAASTGILLGKSDIAMGDGGDVKPAPRATQQQSQPTDADRHSKHDQETGRYDSSCAPTDGRTPSVLGQSLDNSSTAASRPQNSGRSVVGDSRDADFITPNRESNRRQQQRNPEDGNRDAGISYPDGDSHRPGQLYNGRQGIMFPAGPGHSDKSSSSRPLDADSIGDGYTPSCSRLGASSTPTDRPGDSCSGRDHPDDSRTPTGRTVRPENSHLPGDYSGARTGRTGNTRDPPGLYEDHHTPNDQPEDSRSSIGRPKDDGTPNDRPNDSRTRSGCPGDHHRSDTQNAGQRSRPRVTFTGPQTSNESDQSGPAPDTEQSSSQAYPDEHSRLQSDSQQKRPGVLADGLNHRQQRGSKPLFPTPRDSSRAQAYANAPNRDKTPDNANALTPTPLKLVDKPMRPASGSATSGAGKAGLGTLRNPAMSPDEEQTGVPDLESQPQLNNPRRLDSLVEHWPKSVEVIDEQYGRHIIASKTVTSKAGEPELKYLTTYKGLGSENDEWLSSEQLCEDGPALIDAFQSAVSLNKKFAKHIVAARTSALNASNIAETEVQYLVKHDSSSDQQDTWVPAEQLGDNAAALIEAFYQRPHRQRLRARSRSAEGLRYEGMPRGRIDGLISGDSSTFRRGFVAGQSPEGHQDVGLYNDAAYQSNPMGSRGTEGSDVPNRVSIFQANRPLHSQRSAPHLIGFSGVDREAPADHACPWRDQFTCYASDMSPRLGYMSAGCAQPDRYLSHNGDLNHQIMYPDLTYATLKARNPHTAVQPMMDGTRLHSARTNMYHGNGYTCPNYDAGYALQDSSGLAAFKPNQHGQWLRAAKLAPSLGDNRTGLGSGARQVVASPVVTWRESPHLDGDADMGDNYPTVQGLTVVMHTVGKDDVIIDTDLRQESLERL